MKKKHVKITPKDAVYTIGIVSKLLGMPEWTLRCIEKEGLVNPKRVDKKNRYYSMMDIKKLEYIHYLMDQKGVNVRGVKVIMSMRRGGEI